MPRLRTVYICQKCEYQSPQWLGKCPNCNAWSSFIESVEMAKSSTSSTSKRVQPLLNLAATDIEPISLADVAKKEFKRIPTALAEFDRVLGGGVVPGSVVLIGGEPGIGKSTILLQIGMIMASSSVDKVYYVSGEESPQQIKMRAERIGAIPENLIIYPQTDIDGVLEYLNKEILATKKAESKTTHSSIVIVDSVQTVSTGDLESPQGSVSQVKEVVSRLVRFAKQTHTSIFIVGHITKDGTLAGPKVLEHLVDTVIYLEGERYHDLRLMRAAKNRFGSSDEIGVFQMTDKGLKEVTNPSGIFLEERTSAPGAVALPALEGSRPVILEVQALVTQSFLPMPRRTSSGFDINRVQMLIAVLTKRLNMQLFNQDIYVNIVGGLKITEPAADLAVCLAIISSFKNSTLSQTMIAFGEVGLQGEVRRVTKQEKRVEEAKKLGFDQFIYPDNVKSIVDVAKMIK
ncbi:MAG: DNA repair protein RadA [bacterium]|nr:DNA repair protein RadA [bacterium]